MIILGIDPGIADTGYGIITKKGDAYTALEFGSIKTPAHTPLSERLASLYDNLMALIKTHRPDAIAVEELFFAKNTKTAITVSHARGVILLAAKHALCPIFEFTPLQIKQALSGYGRAEKLQVQRMVKTILRLDSIPKPDDAADALAVAITCGQTTRYARHPDLVYPSSRPQPLENTRGKLPRGTEGSQN